MSTLALAFAAAQALAVQLVAPTPALALQFQPAPELAVHLQASQPTLALRFRAPTELDAALLPVLIGPPGPPGTGPSAPTSPTFAYTDGWLTAVVYADGTTKALSYTEGRLAQVDTLRPGLPTMRKTLSYNPDGTLASVTQTVI